MMDEKYKLTLTNLETIKKLLENRFQVDALSALER
jgi:hypothetical protein